MDAHPEHDQAVIIAGELAKAMVAMLECSKENAWKYLEQKQSELGSCRVVSTSEVRRGDPGEEIARSAYKTEECMIIFGTHEKTGQGAFGGGSVASKVFNLVSLLLLLVPTRK